MQKYILILMLAILPCLLIGSTTRTSPPKKTATIRPRRPVALALVEQGRLVLVANRESGTISVVDAKSHKVISETPVAQRIAHMFAAPNGETIYVTDEVSNALLVLTRKQTTLRESHRYPTGPTPVSVCLTADSRFASVACLWPRRLLLFDLTAPKKTPAVVDLPFAPRVQLSLVEGRKLLVADSFGGKLALVDARRKKLDSVRTLPIHNIRGLTFDEKHQSVLLTHQILYRGGQPNPGDIRSSNLIANHVRRLPVANVLNAYASLTRDEELYTVGDVRSGAGDPADVAVSYDGSLLVTFAGVNEFVIGQPKRALWTRLEVGQRPTAIAVDEIRRRAYVANTFSDSISVVDLSAVKVIDTIPLGKTSKLRSAERGEILFYDARLSFEGWYSCHSCHTDGHSNGRLNDNFTDGSFGTPKRVLSLLGVADTPKWAWNGNIDKLERQIHQSLTSTMRGRTPNKQQVRDLVAYLHTLPPPPSLTKARAKTDEQAVQRGRRIFEERRCHTCHKPPTYTSPKTYDVGLRDESGNKRFNPPSLRGISQAGPYFHDGRAQSLEEVLGRFRHRLATPLSPKEMRDLLHFLRSL